MIGVTLVDLTTGEELNKRVTIPSSWDEITVKKWSKFWDVYTFQQDRLQEFTEDMDEDDITLEYICSTYPSFITNIVSFWTEIPYKELMNVQFDNVVGIYNAIAQNFLTPPEQDLNFGDHIEFKGKKYLCRDKMVDIHKNKVVMGKMTFEEWVEYMQLNTMATSKTINKWESIVKQIAIIYRPDGEVYDEEICANRVDLFMDLPMNVVWNVAFFLSDLMSILANNFRKYSESQEEEIAKVMEEISQDGDGTISSSQRLMENFTALIKLRSKTS